MLQYHKGQIELQTEANTRDVADMLAGWSGPVSEFCRTADMLVLAMANEDLRLSFMVISGAAPLLEAVGPGQVLLPNSEKISSTLPDEVACGALAISLSTARRARLNGTLQRTSRGFLLTASEAFTNCRKYIAPSQALEARHHCGPAERKVVNLSEPALITALAESETSFMATISPEGTIDVSHRGGRPGFLQLDPESKALSWDEYVGDGMFKSAGNIRATGRMAMLVLDLPKGDGFELQGTADVTVRRRDRTPRVDALLKQPEAFPVQGRIQCVVDSASWLGDLTHPRRRLQKRQRITSASALEQQYPQ